MCPHDGLQSCISLLHNDSAIFELSLANHFPISISSGTCKHGLWHSAQAWLSAEVFLEPGVGWNTFAPEYGRCHDNCDTLETHSRTDCIPSIDLAANRVRIAPPCTTGTAWRNNLIEPKMLWQRQDCDVRSLGHPSSCRPRKLICIATAAVRTKKNGGLSKRPRSYKLDVI